MENNKFNEEFNIKGVANFVEAQFRTDYERIVEFCKRRQIEAENRKALFEAGNIPANMTKQEVELEIGACEGERRIALDLIEYLERRLARV